MTREEAIKRFEKQLNEAMVVLDSGFGTRPGENDLLFRKRKEMAEIALQALREQEEREKQPQPLTMAELRKMNGETVYCLELNLDVKIYARQYGFIDVSYKFPGTYGECKAMGLTLYRTRPEEEHHG